MNDTAKAHRPVQSLSLFSTSLALLMTAFWGGNAVATTIALDVMPPIAVATVRFALATVFMLGWCLVEREGCALRPSQIRPAFILGCLLFVQISLFNYGIELSNASHGVLLVNTAPFWVAAIEHFNRSDRLTGHKLGGLFLALCGVVVVLATSQRSAAGHPDDPTLAGDLVLVVSAVALAAKIIYTRHAVKSVETGKLILWHDIFGVGLFALLSLATERVEISRITTEAVWALLYNGFIVGGACYAGQAWLLKKHSASQIAVFNFAAPLFGVILAGLMRSDPLSPWLLFSAACVAGGIALVNLRRTPS